MSLYACCQSSSGNPSTNSRQIPQCEWCGANEAPDSLNWYATISEGEEGDQMLRLQGVVFESDGQTPAKEVIVYIYHTDRYGLYTTKGGETGNGLRHGYIRGWIKTNAAGQYRFDTVKPAPYPNRREPAHVHMTLMRDDFEEYWISSTLFEGDSLITDEHKHEADRMGGYPHIVALRAGPSGKLIAMRNIVLDPPEDR